MTSFTRVKLCAIVVATTGVSAVAAPTGTPRLVQNLENMIERIPAANPEHVAFFSPLFENNSLETSGTTQPKNP